MTTSADLEKLFAPYGRVVDVQLVMDRFTRRSRGFGFVYFTRLRDATTVSSYFVNRIFTNFCFLGFERMQRHDPRWATHSRGLLDYS